MIDVVIPYRKSKTEEIHLTIQSIVNNLDHRYIYVLGDDPNIENVIYIPQDKRGVSPQHDVELNIRKALQLEDLSEEFYLFNDDMYVLKKTNNIPLYHAGEIDDVIKEKSQVNITKRYAENLKQTKLWLISRGYTDLLAYTLHIPTVMNKKDRLKVSDMILKDLQNGKRLLSKTIYFNMFIQPSAIHSDVKIYSTEQPQDFASTVDNNQFGIEYVRSKLC